MDLLIKMSPELSYQQQYGVIIVGLGRIGLGYDLNSSDRCCFTHTKAFYKHPGFELIGGVDLVPERRKEFEEFTGKPAVSFLDNLNTNENPAIIVISTPPDDRLSIVQKCLNLKPSLILLEKPLAMNLDEGRKIISMCDENGTKLFVNYFRRCEPSVLQILSDIQCYKFGAFQSGHAFYSGGLFTNASHLVDLILFWLGPPTDYASLGGVSWPSRPGDIDIDFLLDYNGRRCVFQSVDDRVFSMAEVKLIFEKAAIRYEDFGRQIVIHEVEGDPDFVGSRRLGDKPLHISSDSGKYQWNVADHIYNHLTRGDSLVSTGETALETLTCCYALKL